MRREGWASLVLVMLLLAFIGACRAEPENASPTVTAPLEVPLSDVTAQVQFCEVEFDGTVTSNDPELTAYGLPSTSTDYEHVCEYWNGHDYENTVRRYSTTDDDPALPEQVVMSKYAAGALTPALASGTPIQTAITVDTTLLDVMNADANLRAASYANPYYAVYGGCQAPATCGSGASAANGVSSLPLAFLENAAAGAESPRLIARQGVAQLVRGGLEVPSVLADRRVFRRRSGDTIIEYTLSATTQLLLREVATAPGLVTTSEHHWRSTPLGFVRSTSEIKSTEWRDGIPIESTVRIRITNLRIAGIPVG